MLTLEKRWCRGWWNHPGNVVELDPEVLAARALGELYRGGATRGGHSIGLAQCAEIVAMACGLDSPDDAVYRGYIGSIVSDHRYTGWFHWPIFRRPVAQR